jgi:hypothetical protein
MLTIIDNISVTGATIHTPIIPKKYGSVIIAINNTTSPLAEDMTADSLALPIDVK